jgi:hypothetical protein
MNLDMASKNSTFQVEYKYAKHCNLVKLGTAAGFSDQTWHFRTITEKDDQQPMKGIRMDCTPCGSGHSSGLIATLATLQRFSC